LAKTVYKAGSEGEVERISKRADLNNVDRQSAPDGTGPDVVDFWKTELGRYEVEFKPWVQRCENIVRRYRDERDMANRGQVKYAILWSNIQTLKPAVFSRAPQPIVERRYLDQDMLGRIASQTLERATETTVELGRLYQQGDKAILDYLLVGRGQLWDRYEPEYSTASAPITTPSDDGAGPEDVESDGEQDDQPDQEVTWEKVCTDYVYWADFAHSAARSWDEVWWVGRRAWLTREEGLKRFGPIFRRISLKKPEQDQAALTSQQRDRAPKAEVWEIWDKNAREVFFVAPDLTTEILERVPDPLGLHEFYPCPEPIYATLTNGSLVPVPDYAEYQDQADEIDNLTNRISRITGALKVVGLYAGDTPQLARLLLSTVDNTMIPVDNWAVFAEKGGVEGSVSWMPVKDLAGVLMTLYEAREAAKRDLFEITGMSDIVRGQASGAAKTATEQRIKGQFASLRLDSRRKDVARFMRDIIAITGEIIAEHFSPELLMEMTGMLPVITEELKDMEQSAPQPPQVAPQGMAGMGAGPAGPVPPGGAPPPAQMGGAPPQGGGMPMAGMVTAPPPPPLDPQVIAMQVMAKAMELLRNDKMRTFRIDIETDSTVEDDAISGKEEVAEFMGAIAQFLNGVLPVVQAAPPLLPPMVASLQYAMRRFKMGRSVEAAFDAAFEQLEKAAKDGAGQLPPDPALEAAKADAQAKIQSTMIKAQAEQQKAQLDAQVAEQEMQIKVRKLQIDAEMMELEAEAGRQRHQAAMQKIAMQAMMPTPKAANGGASA
jgi:hypothetical protein